jgi:hypothetical protein
VYSGQAGVWTFSVPPIPVLSATVVMSIVADDGTALDADYAYVVWSGVCSYPSTSPPPHGTPFHSPFTDWEQIAEPASVTSGGTYTVTIENTSSLPVTDWIGVDWIELRIETSPVGDAGLD